VRARISLLIRAAYICHLFLPSKTVIPCMKKKNSAERHMYRLSGLFHFVGIVFTERQTRVSLDDSKVTLEFLLQLVCLGLLFPQLLCSSHRSPLDSLLASKRFECIVENPFSRVLDRLIEHIG
jgi:hypothetical protein